MTTIEIDFDRYEGAIADLLLRKLKGDEQGIITSLGFLHDKLEEDGIQNDLNKVDTVILEIDGYSPKTLIYPSIRIGYIEKTNKVFIEQKLWSNMAGVSGVLWTHNFASGSGIIT